MGLGLWIPIAIGIPDSLSCIPDSKVQDSGSKNFPDSGIWIPLHGVSFSRMVFSGWFQEELSFMWRVFFCGCTTGFVGFFLLFYFIYAKNWRWVNLTSFISFDFVLFMTKIYKPLGEENAAVNINLHGELAIRRTRFEVRLPGVSTVCVRCPGVINCGIPQH